MSRSRVVVVLDGGLVHEVRTDVPVESLEVVVVDADTEGLMVGELVELPSGSSVFVHVPWCGPLDNRMADVVSVFAAVADDA